MQWDSMRTQETVEEEDRGTGIGRDTTEKNQRRMCEKRIIGMNVQNGKGEKKRRVRNGLGNVAATVNDLIQI